MTTYAAGLRVGELRRLKPEHIDSQRMLIKVVDGKGRKDRYPLWPPHRKIVYDLLNCRNELPVARSLLTAHAG